MERLQILARHVVTDPPAAADESLRAVPTADAGGNKPLLNQETMQRQMEMLMQYRMGIEKLIQDGTPPPLSMFDLAVGVSTDNTLRLNPNERPNIALRLDEAERAGELSALDALPGPWREAGGDRERQIDVLQQMNRASERGANVHLLAEWMLKYGRRGLSSNIVYPTTTNHGMGMNPKLCAIARVVVGDPRDAARLARTHVRKEPNFRPVLFDSVIATPDNEHWRRQREHLVEAFLPTASLAKIMPTSLARAKHCAARLEKMASGGAPVDVSDFLLHEAQAQLQLALLGGSEETMERTNADLRAGFMGDPTRAKLGSVGRSMQLISADAKLNLGLALPSDGRPVHGPLWRAVQTSGVDPASDYGNVLLVLFAGHDTTGHTMTWLLFELGRHLDIQRELQAEVDAFFSRLDGRDPAYADLGEGLDLLDRCVTETLRMWPAVPNGTFRQLQFDDTVTGPDGEDVLLKRGTFVNIENWARHRNRELWGEDADCFNPYREFQDGEVARVGRPLAAIGIESDRFSPFAHAPRNCLGRNFAQLEMRLILLHLLRRLEFQLAPPYDELVGQELGVVAGLQQFHGVNRGTMGPKDLEKAAEGQRSFYAMKMFAHPRQTG